MHLAEEAVSQASLWGVVGIAVSGLIGLVGIMIQRRGHDDKPKHSKSDSPEKVAASAASAEILEWLEENVLVPLRADLKAAQEKIELLQKQLDKKSEQFNEMARLVDDLRSKIVTYEAQVGLLTRQWANFQNGPKGGTT